MSGTIWRFLLSSAVGTLVAATASFAIGAPASAPDLTTAFEGVSHELVAGQPLGAGARTVARNQGTGLAPGSRSDQKGYMIDVVLSTDTVVPEGFAIFNAAFREDVLLRGGRASNTTDLTPGGSASFSAENDTIPTDTPPGAYRLCARIDPGQVVEEANETNNVTCVQVRVVGPKAPGTLVPAGKPSLISLELSQAFYKTGDQVQAFLDFGSTATGGDVQGVLLVTPDTGDLESLVLRPSGRRGRFAATSEAVVHVARGGPSIPLDSTLAAAPGERVVALFYTDPIRHPRVEARIVGDLAIFETAAGLRDASGAPLTAAVLVEPRLAELDRRAAGSGERGFGTFVPRGGLPLRLATGEVLFRPRSQADLAAFLAYAGGRVLSSQPATADGAAANRPQERLFRVAIDLTRARFDRLPDLRRLFGERHDLLVASDDVARLYALVLESRLQGFAVSANPRLEFMGVPSATETRSSGALEPSMGTINTAIDVRLTWAFNALWEADESRVNAAFLDMGFIGNHPDFRRPVTGSIVECSFDDGFTDDILLRRGHCGPGRASGPPTVGSSFFGSPSWHGTGVVVTAGGVLNNGWAPFEPAHRGGSAGVAGQVLVPMLYEYGLTSYVYEIGSGIRQAVDDGASCINISATYPCRVQSSIVPDVDLCAPGGREGLCAAVFVTASAAAAVVCTHAGLLASIPIVGPFLAVPAIAACGAVTTAAAASLPACQTFFIASGDVRSAMRTSIEHATRGGVPVVASAGNNLSGALPDWLRPFVNLDVIDPGAWGNIPATLPGVIAVGAVTSDTALGNLELAGPSVFVWAPVPSAYHAPGQFDRLPASDSELSRETINATSAAAPYVAGVIANMQAMNPSLNPRTPGLTPTDRAAIPGRIRQILEETAASSPDPLVRRVASPNQAVVRAAAGVIPTLMGYDTALNFDEATPATSADTPSNARTLGFGRTFTGTILRIPDSGGAAAIDDVDHFRVVMPTEPGTYETRIRLRMPNPSRWGELEAFGPAWTSRETVAVSADETELVFGAPRLRHGESLFFAVRGVAGGDNVYKLVVDRPTHTAISGDRFEGSIPAFGAAGGPFPWRKVEDFLTAERWDLSISELSFHPPGDVDVFEIVAFPPSESADRLRGWESDVCTPRLEIVHPFGLDIALRLPWMAEGETATLDVSRRQPSWLDGTAVSTVLNPTPPIWLYYASSPRRSTVWYDVVLRYIAIKESARSICAIPFFPGFPR